MAMLISFKRICATDRVCEPISAASHNVCGTVRTISHVIPVSGHFEYTSDSMELGKKRKE